MEDDRTEAWLRAIIERLDKTNQNLDKTKQLLAQAVRELEHIKNKTRSS